MKEYNTLVLSGGGVRGFAMLGTLQYLQQHRFLNKIKKYIGTSIGAILSVLLIIGYEPSDIIIKFIQKNYVKDFGNYSFVNAIRGNGFLSFDLFSKILKEVLLEKMETIPTLKEFDEKFKVTFTCLTFNYTKKCEEILNSDTFPDLNILDALRMTSNVPLIFDNFLYEGCYYFDGFLANNLPINLLKQTDTCIAISCVQIKWRDETETNLEFWKVIWNIFLLPLYQLQDVKNKPFRIQTDIIEIDVSNYTLLDFKINSSTMLDMFSNGFCCGKEFFEKSLKE